jgi:DEAD/DEAH box helicase
MAEPRLVDSKATFTSFSHLLDARLLRALADMGFARPTLVQSKAIPLALESRDILARARTGSGKTAAYCVPVVQKILSTKNVGTSRLLAVHKLYWISSYPVPWCQRPGPSGNSCIDSRTHSGTVRASISLLTTSYRILWYGHRHRKCLFRNDNTSPKVDHDIIPPSADIPNLLTEHFCLINLTSSLRRRQEV